MPVPQLLPLTVNTEDPSSVHLSHLQALDQACLAGVQLISLSLGGYFPLRPSLAGSYLAAIKRCQARGAKVASTGFAPLVGASAFLWLVADVRRLSPTAYLYLMPPPIAEEPEEVLQRARSDAEFLLPRVESIISAAEAIAYDYCLRVVSEVVEPSLITGRALHEKDLQELLLLGPLPDCINSPASLGADTAPSEE